MEGAVSSVSPWCSLQKHEPPHLGTVLVRGPSDHSDVEYVHGVMWYYSHNGIGHWHAVGEDGDSWDSLTIDVAEAGCPFTEWMAIPP